MSAPETVLDYIRVLVWPSVAMTAVFVFRQRVNDLLKRLTSFEAPGGVKAKFGERLAEARDAVEAAGALGSRQWANAPDPSAPPQQTDPQTDLQDGRAVARAGWQTKYLRGALNLRELASRAPRAAVIAGDELLSAFLGDLEIVLLRETGQRSSAADAVFYVTGNGPLTSAVRTLRSLGSSVIVDGRTEVSVEDAEEYVNTLASLISTVVVNLGARVPDWTPPTGPSSWI